MGRLHLFEFEDQAWFPNILRNYMTDFLRHATLQLGLDRPLISLMQDFIQRSGTTQIVDLCSGGGGLLVALDPHLKTASAAPIPICFTDKFPNHAALTRLCAAAPASRSYCVNPVDATAVPDRLKGARTLFSAFHHFAPETAQAILADAQASGTPIAVIEVSRRSLRGLIAMLLAPLAVLVLTPGIQPQRPSRYLLTYILPLIPFFILWDGIVSALRTYSISELQTLTTPLQHPNYNWTIGRRAGPFGYQITYLFGGA